MFKKTYGSFYFILRAQFTHGSIARSSICLGPWAQGAVVPWAQAQGPWAQGNVDTWSQRPRGTARGSTLTAAALPLQRGCARAPPATGGARRSGGVQVAWPGDEAQARCCL